MLKVPVAPLVRLGAARPTRRPARSSRSRRARRSSSSNRRRAPAGRPFAQATTGAGRAATRSRTSPQPGVYRARTAPGRGFAEGLSGTDRACDDAVRAASPCGGGARSLRRAAARYAVGAASVADLPRLQRALGAGDREPRAAPGARRRAGDGAASVASCPAPPTSSGSASDVRRPGFRTTRSKQWHLTATRAFDFWDAAPSPPLAAVRVAVIDSGIDGDASRVRGQDRRRGELRRRLRPRRQRGARHVRRRADRAPASTTQRGSRAWRRPRSCSWPRSSAATT